MVIIPKGKAIITNLNGYYLKLDRLIEHYQGEVGSGEIFFSSSTGEGILYFDQHEVLEGYLQEKGKEISGKPAVKYLMNLPENVNFSVSIYALDEEDIYFWLYIPSAKLLHDNLSSEFTDLEGLVKKMTTEKLTGYIDIAINSGKANANLFFKNGRIFEDSYSWESPATGTSRKSMAALLTKTKELGGTFKVYQIAVNSKPVSEEPEPPPETSSTDVIPMLSNLLNVLERTANASPKRNGNFATILKKKFLEKADKYSFLDPFADEIQYTGSKLKFTGQADNRELIEAITACVKEMNKEHGLQKQFLKELVPWVTKFKKEIKQYSIKL
ncbi:MAG: hypothetical protein HKM93_00255 [Desulfobacteraceae bacterium]|nr:hypothetical protein [Desulfobacteraceae bacterium]